MARNTNTCRATADLADKLCVGMKKKMHEILKRIEEHDLISADAAARGQHDLERAYSARVNEASLEVKIYSTLIMEIQKISTKYRNKY